MFLKKRMWNFIIVLFSAVIVGVLYDLHQIRLFFIIAILFSTLEGLIGCVLFIYIGIRVQREEHLEGKPLPWYKNLFILMGLGVAFQVLSPVNSLLERHFLQPKGVFVVDTFLTIVESSGLFLLLFFHFVISIKVIQIVVRKRM
ncbi:hypothetical protein [Tengunoibacter tsumagoiensis]|uniref:hypothetical protein n=1 Tax=Tengunoibacter tsumagoiensis TaxID=2014871 RepID=UPI000F833C5D|nr:hypothetical protein [Tengunoibacter tsumagoiensis]